MLRLVFNHFKKWQTAYAHHNYSGSVDGDFINRLEYAIVAQQLESKGTVLVSYFLRFIQILVYPGNTCTTKYSK
jgi:hypothetical protein